MSSGTSSVRADQLSLRQLRLFEGVGRLKSIRRASDECNLSQPAVTQSLAKLEATVGVVLLQRGTNGSYLNELGVILHRRVSRFFEQIEQAIADLGGHADRACASAIARRLTRSQIRSLLLVTDRVSFTDAARIHGLSPASLQRASHDLERNVGRPLYQRSASGITGTPDGIAFGRKIKLAVQEVELGLREIDVARGHAQTRIVLGAMPGGGSVLLASVLDEFLESYPQACVRVVSANAAEILTSLLFGDVDLVVGLIPEMLDDELAARPLASTPYEIVARRGHQLLHKHPLHVEDLAASNWIAGAPSSSRRAVFDQLFAHHPRPLAPIETCSMPVISHLLASSNRLTLMTSYERINQGSQLVPLPFRLPGPVPTIGMMSRRNWLPTSLHLSFVELLQRRIKGAHVPRLVAEAG